MAKIRKDSYGITLEQMKQYFIKHQRAILPDTSR